jgi:hypothetical protein
MWFTSCKKEHHEKGWFVICAGISRKCSLGKSDAKKEQGTYPETRKK